MIIADLFCTYGIWIICISPYKYNKCFSILETNILDILRTNVGILQMESIKIELNNVINEIYQISNIIK